MELQAVFSEESLFLSGDHPTTELCRQLLGECTARRSVGTLLDVGTGDGALALYAAGLGVRRVVAVDRDPARASEAEARVRRAGLERVIEVRALPSTRVEGTFDVVAANLWGDDLLSAAHDLARLTSQGGDLVCSGVRLWQAYQLRQALESAGLRARGIRAAAGWGALHLHRPLAA